MFDRKNFFSYKDIYKIHIASKLYDKEEANLAHANKFTYELVFKDGPWKERCRIEFPFDYEHTCCEETHSESQYFWYAKYRELRISNYSSLDNLTIKFLDLIKTNNFDKLVYEKINNLPKILFTRDYKDISLIEWAVLKKDQRVLNYLQEIIIAHYQTLIERDPQLDTCANFLHILDYYHILFNPQSYPLWTNINNINIVGVMGGTLLHAAVITNSIPDIILLLAKGADASIGDERKESPLDLALKLGHIEALELLLEKIKKEDFGRLLLRAVTYGNSKVILHLLSKTNISCFIELLITAVKLGHCHLIAPLCKKMKLGKEELAPVLKEAIQLQRYAVVRELLKIDPTLGAYDHQGLPMMTALTSSTNPAQVNLLLENVDTVCVTMGENTPFHLAKNVEVLELLFAKLKGAEQVLNNQNICGKTPLMLAVEEQKDLEMVKFLLCHNADPTLANRDGNNVLHLATQFGCKDIVDELLKTDSSGINKPNNLGNTPLLNAKFLPDLTRTLLDHGAEVNAQNSAGDSALLLAAKNNQIEAVKLLISRGAKLLPNNKHETALTVVKQQIKQGNTQLQEFLPILELMQYRNDRLNSPLNTQASLKFCNILLFAKLQGRLFKAPLFVTTKSFNFFGFKYNNIPNNELEIADAAKDVYSEKMAKADFYNKFGKAIDGSELGKIVKKVMKPR